MLCLTLRFRTARAAVEGGVLYVSNGHRTYAESSKGMNGYVTAIDLATGELLWRSEPLVCNSRNFALVGDALICGYGFTAEPDYVYLLEKRTGKARKRVQVKSAPETLIEKDGLLHVRAYNTDYVFRMEGG